MTNTDILLEDLEDVLDDAHDQKIFGRCGQDQDHY
mgnify:CR=1 FL=1